MILRWLWLALVVALLWFLRRILRAATHRPQVPRGQPREEPPRPERTMVRDRVCNTFLPRSRAIVHREAGEEHFFCSESCRAEFLARRGDSGT